jgi:hypothetical protein
VTVTAVVFCVCAARVPPSAHPHVGWACVRQSVRGLCTAAAAFATPCSKLVPIHVDDFKIVMFDDLQQH